MRPFRLSRCVLLAVMIVGSGITPATAQMNEPEFFDRPTRPRDFWRAMNFELGTGQPEQAARYLQGFLDANPTPDDYLAIVEDHDRAGRPRQYQSLTPFLRLRNVVRWSDNPATNTKAKENVEAVLQAAEGALRNKLGDPNRLRQLIAQLTADRSEQLYAENELIKSGVLAMPVMLDYVQGEISGTERSAIMRLLPRMGLDTVPAQVAFLDVPEPILKIDMFRALKRRRDVLQLPRKAETNPIPTLWRYAGMSESDGGVLREEARAFLRVYGIDPDRVRAFTALADASEEFYRHKVEFLDPDQVAIWRYDPEMRSIVPPPTDPPYTPSQAEEYFGLRYAGWALEQRSDLERAQLLFLATAVDKAFERFSPDLPLSVSDPAVHRLLATASEELLLNLFEMALEDERARVLLGVIESVTARGIRAASLPYRRTIDGQQVTKTALLERALDYPSEPRVQVAAANALLSMPGEVRHNRRQRVLDVLGGLLEVKPPADANDVPPMAKATLADADRVRAAGMARLMRDAGYQVTIVPSGFALLRHLERNPDTALVVIDRHLVYPLLPDTLAGLRQSPALSRIPTLLIASPDVATYPPTSNLLLRLAVLVASTDPVEIEETVGIPTAAGVAEQQARDVEPRVNEAIRDRLDRMKRLVRATDLPLRRELEAEMELYTLAVARLDLPITPSVQGRFERIRDQVAAQEVRTIEDEPLYAGRLVTLVDTVVRELSPEAEQRVREFRTEITRHIRIPVEIERDLTLEANLRLLTNPYKRIAVVPELWTLDDFEEAVAIVDEGLIAPSPEWRQEKARLAARWLAEIAAGRVPGYDVKPLAATIRRQLSTDDADILLSAIRAVRFIPGTPAQQDLANMMLTVSKPPELRALAAEALAGHIQEFGKLVTPDQIMMISEQANAELEPAVRGRLEALVGILSGSTPSTTERLLQFQPPAPMN